MIANDRLEARDQGQGTKGCKVCHSEAVIQTGLRNLRFLFASLIGMTIAIAPLAHATYIPITVEESDASPSAKQVKKIKVSNGTLTDDGSGTVTVSTTAAANSLDFDDFENTLDLDAALILNQSTNTWTQNFTGDTTVGLTYNANSLTSGKGLSVASSKALTFSGALAAFALTDGTGASSITGPVVKVTNAGTANANAALMVTNAANDTAAESFRVNDDGTDTDSTPFIVDEAGNVGIGTAGPGYKLHVEAAQPAAVIKSTTTTTTTLGAKDARVLMLNDSLTANAGAEFVVAAAGDTNVERYVSFGADITNNTVNGVAGDAYIATKAADTDTALSRRLVVKSSGSVGVGTSTPDRRLHSEIDDATNGMTYVTRLTHTKNDATITAGMGTGLEFETETADANNEIGSIIESVTTNVGAGTEAFDLAFKNMAGGAAASEVARISSTGLTTLGAAGVDGSLKIYSEQGATDYYSLFQPGTQTMDITYTLPPDDGDAGEQLQTNGSGVLTWESAGSGMANTALSNLASVAVNASLVPGAAGTLDLGSGTLPWRDYYLAGTSGTPGTNNFKITGASTSGTRTITLPDATTTLVGTDTTQTFTNKVITPRVVVITDATSVTINADTTDIATQVNTQAAGTLTMNAPTGTPFSGQKIIFRIKSTNVQTYSWNAAFRGGVTVGLPATSSGSSKTDYLGFIYNAADSKWDMIAYSRGY